MTFSTIIVFVLFSIAITPVGEKTTEHFNVPIDICSLGSEPQQNTTTLEAPQLYVTCLHHSDGTHDYLFDSIPASLCKLQKPVDPGMINPFAGMDSENQKTFHEETTDGRLGPSGVIEGLNVTVQAVQPGGGTSWYPLEGFVVPFIHHMLFRMQVILTNADIKHHEQQDTTVYNDTKTLDERLKEANHIVTDSTVDDVITVQSVVDITKQHSMDEDVELVQLPVDHLKTPQSANDDPLQYSKDEDVDLVRLPVDHLKTPQSANDEPLQHTVAENVQLEFEHLPDDYETTVQPASDVAWQSALHEDTHLVHLPVDDVKTPRSASDPWRHSLDKDFIHPIQFVEFGKLVDDCFQSHIRVTAAGNYTDIFQHDLEYIWINKKMDDIMEFLYSIDTDSSTELNVGYTFIYFVLVMFHYAINIVLTIVNERTVERNRTKYLEELQERPEKKEPQNNETRKNNKGRKKKKNKFRW